MSKRTREEATAEPAKRERKEKVHVKIWTDGSHIKGTTKMGFGIYVCAGDKTGEVSVSASPPYLQTLFGLADVSAVPSNPTLELAAAVLALRMAAPFADRISHVTLYADYNGVVNYANSAWDAKRASPKTPVFAAAARHLQDEVKRVRKLVPVEVVWVRGHSGNAGNNWADRLAKIGDGRNTFVDAFQ